jgi:hypothetical protein
MPQLFDRSISRQDLRTHTGAMSQLGGIRLATLADGNEEGVKVADVRTGTGFNFTVALSRGMDICLAEWCGRSLCWHSATGVAHPAYYEPEGLGWLRTFYGGLLTTCGLTYAGAPCEDGGEALGIHGRASHLPARRVSVDERWQGDDYLMSVSGRLVEARAGAENVALERTITARLGESRLHLRDVVRNEGHQAVPHMMLYHINGGYPAIGPDARLIAPSLEARPRDAEAEKEADRWAECSAPIVGFAERVYYHRMAADAQGLVTAALVNRGLGDGFGFYVRYRRAELPKFVQWKMMGAGAYVVGMEPANCWVGGRDQERASGELQFLEPGEEREYLLEIGVIAGAAAVDEIERAVEAASSS